MRSSYLAGRPLLPTWFHDTVTYPFANSNPSRLLNGKPYIKDGLHFGDDGKAQARGSVRFTDADGAKSCHGGLDIAIPAVDFPDRHVFLGTRLFVIPDARAAEAACHCEVAPHTPDIAHARRGQPAVLGNISKGHVARGRNWTPKGAVLLGFAARVRPDLRVPGGTGHGRLAHAFGVDLLRRRTVGRDEHRRVAAVDVPVAADANAADGSEIALRVGMPEAAVAGGFAASIVPPRGK